MQRFLFFVLVIAVFFAVIYIGQVLLTGNKQTFLHSNMDLRSNAFDNKGDIPLKYTCDGDNVSPPFFVGSAPIGTQSFALVVEDPDAIGGVTFDHWVVWNIKMETTEIKEGFVPDGAMQGINDFDEKGYGGPCPPKGASAHRYLFNLYALDTRLNINPDSRKEHLEKAMEGHILGQTTLLGLYKR